jgi:serine/threonine protein kinase
MNAGERISDYVVERVLGEGGMGTVYLARHTVLDQQVAIKILDPEVARKPGVKERFIQEANIQAKLKHPHIVQVLTATQIDGGTPALVMEYVDGKTLSEVLELRGALPIDDALKIMTQVFSAVAYAHQQGVIHRDLKPSNVMVMASGEVKVTDFGIAKVMGSTRLTRTGTAMGSAHYMSPEQIRRPETVDARSDVYSLGCVFYEILTGQPPFGEKDVSGTESDFEIKEAHVRGQAPQLTNLRKDIPDWLEGLVMHTLEKAPEKRPSRCEEILAIIRNRLGLTVENYADEQTYKQSLKTSLITEEAALPDESEPENIRKQTDKKQSYQKMKRIPRIRFAAALGVVVCVWFLLLFGNDIYTDFMDSLVTENTGKFAINPLFDEAEYFYDGLAAIRIGDHTTGKYGFIDKEGKIVITPQFDEASSFSEGLAAVRIGDETTGKYGFIDKEGKIVIAPQFDGASSFSEDLARVQTGDWLSGKYGFINKEGKIVVPLQFDLAGHFSEGLAYVRIGDDETGKYGFINKEGKIVVPPQFDYANNFSEGLASVRKGDYRNGKYGFINKEGKIVITPQFDYTWAFFDGLAHVRMGDDQTGKYGFINKEGKIVITPQFDEASNFSEDLAYVRMGDDKTGKYGFINKEGKLVINPQFDDAMPFLEGLASVRMGDDKTGKYGFINKEGKMVIHPQFDVGNLFMFYGFINGLAVVHVGDEKTGKKGFIARR